MAKFADLCRINRSPFLSISSDSDSVTLLVLFCGTGQSGDNIFVAFSTEKAVVQSNS